MQLLHIFEHLQSTDLLTGGQVRDTECYFAIVSALQLLALVR